MWWVLSLVTALALGALWAWNWWLPGYLGEQILPSVADQFGVGNLHCEVRRLGLTGVDLANVSVTDLNGRALGINSVRMDYSLRWPGKDKRAFLVVDQVALSGLQLGVRVDDSGMIAIDGLDWAEILKRLSTTTAKEAGASEQPAATASGVQINTLLFENIRLYLAWHDELLVVPSELRVDLQNGNIQITGSMELRSGTLDFVAVIDPTSRRIAIKVVGSCPLEHFSGLLPFDYRGNVAYSGLVRMSLDRLWPTAAELEFSLADGPEFLRELTMQLAFTGNPDGVGGGSLDVHVAAGNSIVSGELQLKEGKLEVLPDGLLAFAGHPELTVTPAPMLPVRFPEPVKGDFGCRFRQTPEGWLLELPNGTLQLPTIGFAGDGTISTPSPLRFDATLELPTGGAPSLRYQLQAQSFDGRIAGTQITIPAWNFVGSLTEGALSLDHATVIHEGLGLRAEEIRLDARYPGETVVLKIGELDWQGVAAADAEAHFQLSEEQREVNFTAQLHSRIKLTEALKLELAGRWQFNGDYELKAELPLFRLPEGTDLGEFTGGTKLLVSGVVSAQAALHSRDDELTSDGKLSLTRLQVQMPEAAVEVKNMNLTMKFSDLLNLRTPTGQRLTVEALKVGVLQMKHGEVSFKIDSPRQINLEDSSIEWCGGNLSTRYMRIIPGRNYYQTTVQCEDLNLAQVLTELGLVRADGDGKVWGKMPIRFSDRGMFFNTSYLYSIPGENSSIRIADADVLLNSMSPELAKSIQGELTVAALRDFQYNWARMNFATEGEDLVVNLKFNGKPTNPLPFRYDEQTGSLSRVSANAGAIFQGIDLDFTARFPLNRVMKLTERLNKIWGKL